MLLTGVKRDPVDLPVRLPSDVPVSAGSMEMEALVRIYNVHWKTRIVLIHKDLIMTCLVMFFYFESGLLCVWMFAGE